MHRTRVPLAVALAAAFSGSAHADVVADSVTDFGGVQGAANWHYGYIDPAQGPGFIPFPSFGLHAGAPLAGEEPAWFIEYFGEPIIYPTPYTHLTATGGHPNTGDPVAGPVHFTVRRWVSELAGAATISGLFGDYTPDLGAPGGQDGVTGRIYVDGEEVWSRTTTGQTADAPYAVTVQLAHGAVVDLVVEPNGNQVSDAYTWTAEIAAACRADWNGDAAVNSNDISSFLGAWLASVAGGTLVGDYSGNGLVDSNDISVFLTAWLDAVTTGC